MKVITAQEEYKKELNDVTCFLAGGISGCKDWQSKVIEELEKYPNTDKLVLFNPRRENFPIDDPSAAEKQITWEFNLLNDCDIFSMYFDGGESIQPICLYELGRHLALKKNGPIVSVEDGYKRTQDVLIQAKLANKDVILLNGSNPEIHAKEIYKEYLKNGGCPYHESYPYPSAFPGLFQGYVDWCNKNDGPIMIYECNETDCDKCEECKV